MYLLTCIYDMGLSLHNFRTSSEIKQLYRRREDVNAIRQICINLLPCLCVCVQILFGGKKHFWKKYIGYEKNKRTDMLEPNKIKSGYYNNWAAIDWLLSGIFFVFLFFMTYFFISLFLLLLFCLSEEISFIIYVRKIMFTTSAKRAWLLSQFLSYLNLLKKKSSM